VAGGGRLTASWLAVGGRLTASWLVAARWRQRLQVRAWWNRPVERDTRPRMLPRRSSGRDSIGDGAGGAPCHACPWPCFCTCPCPCSCTHPCPCLRPCPCPEPCPEPCCCPFPSCAQAPLEPEAFLGKLKEQQLDDATLRVAPAGGVPDALSLSEQERWEKAVLSSSFCSEAPSCPLFGRHAWTRPPSPSDRNLALLSYGKGYRHLRLCVMPPVVHAPKCGRHSAAPAPRGAALGLRRVPQSH